MRGPPTLTPERSTAAHCNIVCLRCSLVPSSGRCPRTESRVWPSLEPSSSHCSLEPAGPQQIGHVMHSVQQSRSSQSCPGASSRLHSRAPSPKRATCEHQTLILCTTLHSDQLKPNTQRVKKRRAPPATSCVFIQVRTTTPPTPAAGEPKPWNQMRETFKTTSGEVCVSKCACVFTLSGAVFTCACVAA